MRRITFIALCLLMAAAGWSLDLQTLVDQELVGRTRFIGGNTYREFTLRFDITKDVFRDVRVEVLWEFTDTNKSTARRLNNVSVWDLEGDYRSRTRTLILEELGRDDPNEFLSTWWNEMHIVFNSDGTEFIATMFRRNGNPVRDNGGNTVEIIGRAR